MYHDGICGDLWILLRNMYRIVSVKVKWDNNLSRKIDVAQGIRKGAKLSTMLYKRYNNNILEVLERSGNLRVVSPTCAYNIAILSCSKHEAQALLEIALILTDKDLVRINPTKTDLAPLTRKATNFELNMRANSIEQTNETKHLGPILYSVIVILPIKAHLLLAGKILSTILHRVISIQSTST